jgi:hypothetical protein
VIDDDAEIGEFEAQVIGPQQVCRLAGFGAADAGDVEGPQLGAAAIAGRHRRNRDVAAELLQAGQRSRALELDVVGVGMNRQDARRRGRIDH